MRVSSKPISIEDGSPLLLSFKKNLMCVFTVDWLPNKSVLDLLWEQYENKLGKKANPFVRDIAVVIDNPQKKPGCLSC